MRKFFRYLFHGGYLIGAVLSMLKLLFVNNPHLYGTFSFLSPVGVAVQRALYAPAYYLTEHSRRSDGILNVFVTIIAAVAIIAVAAWYVFKTMTDMDSYSDSRHPVNPIINSIILIAALFSVDYVVMVSSGSCLFRQLHTYPYDIIASPVVEIYGTLGGGSQMWLTYAAAGMLCLLAFGYTIRNIVNMIHNCHIRSDRAKKLQRQSIGNPLLAIIVPILIFIVSAIFWIPAGWAVNFALSTDGLPDMLFGLVLLIAAFLGVGVIWGIKAPIIACDLLRGKYRFVFWIHFLLHVVLAMLLLNPDYISSSLPTWLSDKTVAFIPNGIVSGIRWVRSLLRDFLLQFESNGTTNSMTTGLSITMLAGLIGLLYCRFHRCNECGRYNALQSHTWLGKKLGTKMTTSIKRSKPQSTWEKKERTLLSRHYIVTDSYDETREHYTSDIYTQYGRNVCCYCGYKSSITESTTERNGTYLGKETESKTRQRDIYI